MLNEEENGEFRTGMGETIFKGSRDALQYVGICSPLVTWGNRNCP
jgi:hypothetical protein